jgi:hypothetical protein
MAETGMIYAAESIAANGSPVLELYRRPATLDLDYDTVKSWGVIATGNRPDFTWFRGDLYLTGGFSRVLVRHRSESRWRPAGIRAPTDRLSVVEGTGADGSPGQALCYTTFVHKQGPRLLAESNPSNVVVLLDQTGKGYDWTLQTSGAEERVTHVRGYRSMNGGSYRLAFETPYGTTGYTENVKTNQLLQTGPSGNYLPPFGVAFAEKAFGRMWYARTNEYPHRLWGSEGGQPQNVPITNYRDTDDREAITGLKKSRDVLLVFCLNSTYILRKHGSSGFDFTLQKIDSAVGCTSHWAIQEIHNKLWFPSTDGVWIYDGGLRYAMADIRDFYRQDYEANREAFSKAFAIDERTGKNYLLFVPRPKKPAFQGESAVGTVCYVGNYLNFEPSIGGQNPEPDWSMDVYGRRHTAAVYSNIGETVIASEDGGVRQFDESDDDDDGDSLQKHLIIKTGHQLFMDAGDDIEGGKVFGPVYVHMDSEFCDWKASLYGGDESAAANLGPPRSTISAFPLPKDNAEVWWKKDVEASAKIIENEAGEVVRLTPKTVHFMTPERVGGRGLTAIFESYLTQHMSFRGFGGWYKPGGAQRPPEAISTPDTNIVCSYQHEDSPGVWSDIFFGVGLDLLAAANPHSFRLRIFGAAVLPVYAAIQIIDPDGQITERQFVVTDGSGTLYTAEMSVTLEVGTSQIHGVVLGGDGESYIRANEELRVT